APAASPARHARGCHRCARAARLGPWRWWRNAAPGRRRGTLIMLFRRAQLRYSQTPVTLTAYQAAAQAWDERIGSARVQARNWRLMAFVCLGLALLMSAALAWHASQAIVTPYVVEVDTAGQIRAVGEAATPY